MKFSEYVVLGRRGLAPDPLGFLTPYTTLQDTLFKQFTVLSNLPAYHGILALIYQCLEEQGIQPGNKDFARQFRRAEIFWGLLHAFGLGTASVLNITKYEAVLAQRGEKDDISLNHISEDDRVYTKLGYGVLGHYSSPSATWGILSKAGRKLTAQGVKLGEGFGARKATSLKNALKSWMNGTPCKLEQIQALAYIYEAHADPNGKEAKAWRSLIDDYCEQEPDVSSLLRHPMSEEQYETWQTSAKGYRNGFAQLKRQHPSLHKKLDLIHQFEQLTGLIEHIFECAYLQCSRTQDMRLQERRLETALVKNLREVAKKYTDMPGHVGPERLLQDLAAAKDYDEAAILICDHHASHQRAKNSTPFMEDGELRMLRMIAEKDVITHIKELSASDDLLTTITFQHHGDWHFQRANTYVKYANAA